MEQKITESAKQASPTETPEAIAMILHTVPRHIVISGRRELIVGISPSQDSHGHRVKTVYIEESEDIGCINLREYHLEAGKVPTLSRNQMVQQGTPEYNTLSALLCASITAGGAA